MREVLPRFRVNGIDGAAPPHGDRGLLYGDGLFETVSVRDGRPLRLDRHLARLAHGCAALGIAPPDLHDEVTAFCAGTARAVLKVIVSRGGGARGYQPDLDAVPNRMLSLHPWPAIPDAWTTAGIAVRWCNTRLAVQPALAGLKHLNRLEQVLARREWDDLDTWQEGIVCDTTGAVVEATQANLFIVLSGVLSTPALTGSGVAGIIRGMLIEAAPTLGIDYRVATLSRMDVASADEAFTCNSVTGILPVRRIGTRSLAAPGALTVRLQRWLATAGTDY